METNDVDAAIYEAGRLASMASSTIDPPPDLDPAIHAQLASAWALIAVARAIAMHAERLPPA